MKSNIVIIMNSNFKNVWKWVSTDFDLNIFRDFKLSNITNPKLALYKQCLFVLGLQDSICFWWQGKNNYNNKNKTTSRNSKITSEYFNLVLFRTKIISQFKKWILIWRGGAQVVMLLPSVWLPLALQPFVWQHCQPGFEHRFNSVQPFSPVSVENRKCITSRF